VPDAVDPRHQRAAGDEPDQQPGDRQHGDGAGEAIPEVGLQRCEQSVVPADEQVVAAAELRNVNQGRLYASSIIGSELDRIVAGRDRYRAGPRP